MMNWLDGRSSRHIWGGLLAGCLLLAAALLLYRPWDRLPFDVWDFQEFLPILKAHDSPAEQFVGLAEYYARAGRTNLAFYASFVAQWQVFGMESSGWQWYRFGFMLGTLVLIFAFLRKVGASGWGAAGGTALFVGATAAHRAWLQLLAEPQALAALLIGALLAWEYQGARKWGLRAVLIAGCLLFAMMSKETLGILGPLVVSVACLRQADGSWRVPSPTPRTIAVAGAALLAAGIAAAMLLVVRQRPEAVGYAMSYGDGAVTLSRWGTLLIRSVLPHQSPQDLRFGLLYPSNLVFIALVVLGWGTRLRRRPAGQVLGELLLILLIPALGTAVYLPWPKFDTFYGMPLLIGAALLTGVAVTELEQRSRIARTAARSMIVVMAVYSLLATQVLVSIANASLRLNHRVARDLPRLGANGPLALLGPEEGPRELPVKGAELKGYAVALGFGDAAALPAIYDGPCTALPSLLSGELGRIGIISYSYGCGRLPNPTTTYLESFQYRDWLTFARRSGTLAIEIILPGPEPAPK